MFGRIFEKFLADWTLDNFSPHIDIKHYGNISDSSTKHQVDLVNNLIRFFVELIDLVTMHRCVPFISLKAFDQINHNVAVKKPIDIGVRSEIIPVICSFLTNQTQEVKYLGIARSLKVLTLGRLTILLWKMTLTLRLIWDEIMWMI